MNPQTTSWRPRRQTGFTVVEVVVLISIVGIMGAVAAPRFLAMSEMSAVRAHRQALSDLRFAQALSASSGCPVQVDFGGSTYTLTKRTGCRSGAFTLPVVDPLSNQAPYVINLPVGVSITSTIDPLVFDALGRSTTTAGMVTNAALSVSGHSLEAIGETGLVRVP